MSNRLHAVILAIKSQGIWDGGSDQCKCKFKLRLKLIVHGFCVWQVIDAAQSVEDVHEDIKQLSEAVIKEARDQPIGKLWVED